MTAKKSPPDRIRNFTSLADPDAAGYEGKVVTAEHNGYTLRRVWHQGEWWHAMVDVLGALTEIKDAGGYWRNHQKTLATERGRG